MDDGFDPQSPGGSPIARLVDAFHRLPGIGPKSAQRLAYYILRAPEQEARDLAEALIEVKESVVLCSRCQNVTDRDPCRICADMSRDRTVICVVEEPLDVVAIDRTGGFRGLYHVLHGVISPSDGVGPEDLKINELLARIRDFDQDVAEVIVATNPNLEGEATSMYLARLLRPLGLKVTRLARGLPAGADLEYADDVTLGRAMEFRQEA
ncbi:MAG: recombination protein RecR [Chloroflexi bacterium HGW-Chloroflexi-9]|nr:MAG: recombination protein RecR [Chloroflexi bacterium HGW-Chloroflexi-9]